ncbi:MAG: hypothetical protein KBB70_01345 [Candidatus Pacebacteria bacterium]|nr:hypothetical protein [Candidatus Paceibacterota bacterium]
MKKYILIPIIIILAIGFVVYRQNEKKEIETTEDVEVIPEATFSFNYTFPDNWQKYSNGLTRYNVLAAAVLDPQKSAEKLSQNVSQTMVDAPAGLVTITRSQDNNSYVIGYNEMPIVIIGKDGKITARKFEKFYPKDAPEVSAQGMHQITYYIGENETIFYSGDYSDAYLAAFNAIINNLTPSN